MTRQENAELCVLLDNIWGGVDEGREAGYLTVLQDDPYDLVLEAVHDFARGKHRRQEDLKWLPRAPEIAARVTAIRKRNEHQAWIDGCLERLTLEAGDR